MPVLEISEVCVAFGGAQVLSDVSLTVAEGGVTAGLLPLGYKLAVSSPLP